MKTIRFPVRPTWCVNMRHSVPQCSKQTSPHLIVVLQGNPIADEPTYHADLVDNSNISILDNINVRQPPLVKVCTCSSLSHERTGNFYLNYVHCDSYCSCEFDTCINYIYPEGFS